MNPRFAAVRRAAIYAFIGINLACILHINVVQPGMIPASAPVRKAYAPIGRAIGYYGFLAGNRGRWSMFSPGAKENVWIEWYMAQAGEERFLPEFSPNAPASREQLGLLEAQARYRDGTWGWRLEAGDVRLCRMYAEYIRRRLGESGIHPKRIYALRCVAPIPLPNAADGGSVFQPSAVVKQPLFSFECP